MDTTSLSASSQKDRIYLRVPARMRAAMLVEGHLYAKVMINDLSSTGLSFTAPERIKIPHTFEIAMRVPGRLWRTRVGVEVKNSRITDSGQRIGCLFTDISSSQGKIIADYVSRFGEFTPACRIFSFAAFLIFADALVRIFIWLISIYYKDAHTEYPFIKYEWSVYSITLLLYATASFLACLYSCDIKKKRYMLSAICGMSAFIFIAVKYAFYCRMGLWGCEYVIIRTFFWIESFIVGYAAYAAVLFLSSQKKIAFIADSINSHSKGFRNRPLNT